MIVTNMYLDKLKKSILEIDSKKLTHHSNFFLAINAYLHDRKKLALKYLDIALEKAWYQFDIDKVNFWRYQITKEKHYLEKLEESFDANIYTLYADNILDKKRKNIINEIKVKYEPSVFNEQNPFEWLVELDKSTVVDYNLLQHYEDIFTTKNTIPHLALMYEKYSKYATHYFLTPYENELKEASIHRKALIYALTRQESRFIPTSISSSYALGIMQFMPFVAESISKEKKIALDDLDDLFDVQKSLEFGMAHLDFLEARLDQVLYIAYAYNGGIGFTTRMLQEQGRFTTDSELEPFLSMELVPYAESRKYGKKVLANYIIYRELLGDKIDFKETLKKIKSPYLDPSK